MIAQFNKKAFLFFFLPLLMVQSCTEETFPSCEDLIGDIHYPFIAHSHNDYRQDVPITTALKHGFRSIEVDVAFDDLRIRISHDDKDLGSKPMLDDLYLAPLSADTIHEDGMILLIDIKNYSEELMDALHAEMTPYANVLVNRNQPNDTSHKVQIILSGDIPRQEIMAETKYEYFFLDGRMNANDLDSDSDLMPWISMNIDEISNSNADDKDKLREAIRQVHDKGKSIRFWNTNDCESVWLSLIDLKVDIIGVDNIEKFCGMMRKNGFIR